MENNKYINSEYWSDISKAVVWLDNSKYKIQVDIIYNDYGMPVDAKIIIEPTNEPASQSNKNNLYYKFGGYPIFMQCSVSPTSQEDGKPYNYICTINNSWGDSGTGNVFALIRDGQIKDVYVEASCS